MRTEAKWKINIGAADERSQNAQGMTEPSAQRKDGPLLGRKCVSHAGRLPPIVRVVR
jgi:hypothetical protein